MKALNDAHKLEYEVLPEVVAKAPGRIHFAGEHSWFYKDKTISMAINLLVHVGVSKRDDGVVKIYFHQLDDRKKSNLSSIKYKKEDKWANPIKSVLYGFTSGGYTLSGMDISVYSDIMPSAGFGITSAMKAATAIAVRKLYDLNCSDSQLLQVLERGNRLFMKKQNYLSDNFAALFSKKGNLILTDYAKNTWDYVPFNFDNRKIILTDTTVPRVSVWDEELLFDPKYALLLGELKDKKNNVYGGWSYINNSADIEEILSVLSKDEQRKLVAIIREHGDVLDIREGVEKGDFFKFARAINHSHETIREFFDLSCPEIEWIVKRINELEPNLEHLRNPVTCGRLTGKGYGRCIYSIMRDIDVENYKQKLLEFEKIFGFHPVTFEVECEDGARIVV
ncbi:MAG: galactokinase [Treponema bryantii]|nr:galactokinase [Treponema bryantii]MBR6583647.1 galactokinase [Treponema sp.]